MRADGFIWQPYSSLPKKFLNKVSKVDRSLMSSSTVLIFYWIVERHNTWRVMKQFGLMQVVPPPFNIPVTRRERTTHHVIDYSQNMDKEVEVLWDARSELGLRGVEDTTAQHTEEYMLWFCENTIMYIGRQVPVEQPAVADQTEGADVPGSPIVPDAHDIPSAPDVNTVPTVPQKHVQDLVLRLERSLQRASRKKAPMEKLYDSISKKINKFKAYFETSWEDFSMDRCSSSQSEEDLAKKKITITFVSRKKAAVKSPMKKRNSSRQQPLSVEDTPEHKADETGTIPPSPIHHSDELQPMPPSLSQHIEEAEGMPQIPDLPVFQEVLCTPPISRSLFASPVPVSSSSALVVSAPLASLHSLVWRIKRMPRMRKVPLKFEDYVHFIVEPDYVLSEGDKFFLKGFKEYYAKRRDELDSICTMVKAEDLHKLLDDGTWMDTNIMYYYFELLRDGCASCFIADPSVCSWWRSGVDNAYENVFGKHGHRVWEAREARTLVFIVYHRSHFALLVGYVDERRWEFYNSMPKDRRTLKHVEKFVGWINEGYSHFDWSDPYLWSWEEKTDIPHQHNSNDCGVFALAFATHCVHCLPISFTQSHISYFRCKIVVEIFKRSWQLNANRLGLTDLTDYP